MFQEKHAVVLLATDAPAETQWVETQDEFNSSTGMGAKDDFSEIKPLANIPKRITFPLTFQVSKGFIPRHDVQNFCFVLLLLFSFSNLSFLFCISIDGEKA